MLQEFLKNQFNFAYLVASFGFLNAANPAARNLRCLNAK